MEGWTKDNLGNLIELVYGKSLPKTKRVDGNIPVYGSNGIVGFHCEAIVNEPGIIVGRKGSAGNIHYSKVPFCPIDTTFYITQQHSKLDLDFLYYALDFLDLKRILGDVGVPGLNREMAYLEELFYPLNKAEQRKIAHVLSTIQKAIEQQDNLILTTTELKKALMQKLFTEGTRGEPLKETEIGLVPESWDVKPFSEIFEIIKNQSHSRDKLTFEKTESEVLNLHYGDIHAKFKSNIVDLELEEVPYIIDEYVDKIKNNYLRDGDIVIADASEDLIDIGKCIELKNVKNRKIIGGLHTIIARNKINLIQKGFGAYIFKNKYVSTELRFIGKTMDRCNKKIFFHQKKKQTLNALFKTLLHELMTGQRRVHELDMLYKFSGQQNHIIFKASAN